MSLSRQHLADWGWCYYCAVWEHEQWCISCWVALPAAVSCGGATSAHTTLNNYNHQPLLIEPHWCCSHDGCVLPSWQQTFPNNMGDYVLQFNIRFNPHSTQTLPYNRLHRAHQTNICYNLNHYLFLSMNDYNWCPNHIPPLTIYHQVTLEMEYL